MRLHRGFLIAAILLAPHGAGAAVLNIPADFATVQQGIDAAGPGDTIHIAPGEYVESLAIAGKNLTLRGDGFLQTVLRSPSASDFTLTVTGATVTLRDLRFEGLALNQFFTLQAINAVQATLVLRQIHIKRYTFSHLNILDGHLDIEDVSIGPCEEEGAPFPCGTVITSSDLGLRITHSTFVIRRLSGGHLPPGTTITGGTDHLIDISGSSSGLIENCVLAGNGAINSNAIRLHDGINQPGNPNIPGPFSPVPGNPTAVIRDNVLVGAGNDSIPRAFTEGGIALGAGSFADIEGNTISGFAAGLYVYGNASAKVHGNRITGNHRDGVVTNIGIAPGYNGAVPDLGGGAQLSPGGNAICENGLFDLYQRSTAAVFAKNNTWGSAQASVIDQAIHDDDEDPAVAAVNFTPLHPQSAQCNVITTFVSETLFAQAAGQLTLIDFDADPFGQPIAAPSPGILADDLFAPLGIDFAAGVVFGETNLPFPGASPPNTISNSQINTPTPALVDGRFTVPVSAVGITNAGAGSILRAFDVADNLIGSMTSDSNDAALDFIGIVSQTPIRRFEFDFVTGPGFDGDNLLFTRILTLTPPGMNLTVQPVDTRTGASPVTVTFGEVTGGGSTGLTTSVNGPPGPTSFQICNPPVYYDLTTSATIAQGSTIEVCIDYSGLGCNPQTVAIYHFEDTDSDGLPDAWVNVTTSHDTVNHIICGTVGSLSLFGLFQPALFRRGDANADRRIDIADPIFAIHWLFLGGAEPACLEAANANDSRGVDVADPVYLIQYLFLGGPPPAAPFPACGPVPSIPDCRSYPACP